MAENANDVVEDVPFVVPESYALEPELQGDSPRPMPQWVDDGRLAKQRRLSRAGFFATGVICLLLSQLPWIDDLAFYFLPLGYLFWIGAVCLLVGGVQQLSHAFVLGPFRYLRDGVPLVVRILGLVKAPSAIVNGEAAQFAFQAVVDFEDPDSRERVGVELKSSSFSSSKKEATGCSYRVGDYVTALYLPGKYPKTLQLYGFLDLKPDFGLVRQDDSAGGSSFGKLLAEILAVVVLLFVLFWNVYAYQRFLPIDFDYRAALVPIVVGGLILGGGFLALSMLSYRREKRLLAQRVADSLESGQAIEVGTTSLWGRSGLYGWGIKAILVVGAPILGGLIAFCWAITANALLDKSQARQESVVIEDMVVTTNAFIFRDYTVKFRLGGSSEARSQWATPSEMAVLMLSQDDAVAEVREGRFGWPWVESLRPRVLAPGSVPGSESAPESESAPGSEPAPASVPTQESDSPQELGETP